jgi:hypothetical protein
LLYFRFFIHRNYKELSVDKYNLLGLGLILIICFFALISNLIIIILSFF